MSRIGKKPITVPSGVKVALDPKARTIEVEGPKGKLRYEYRPEVSVTWDQSESRIVCAAPDYPRHPALPETDDLKSLTLQLD